MKDRFSCAACGHLSTVHTSHGCVIPGCQCGGFVLIKRNLREITMKNIKGFCMLMFIISLGLIVGVLCSITKLYFWCISPDCFSIWVSILGHSIVFGSAK